MRNQAQWVHYVVPDGPETVHGQCRPACVVREWDGGLINLVVFRDGANDRRMLAADGQTVYDDALMQWETSVPHSLTHEFRSWHTASECRHGQP